MHSARTHLFMAAFLLLSTSLFSQLQLKLQLLPGDTSWGVFVKPNSSINPTTSTTTGSGQVTVVVPTGFVYDSLKSVSGLWYENSHVVAPAENPARDYISFGFNTDSPHINYVPGQETLLFTFQKTGSCPDSLYLIQNGVDPFDMLPNSEFTNPGNDLSVVDFGVAPLKFYYYSNNYAPSAWNCQSAPPPAPQLQLKLQLMPGDTTWGVFVKTDSSVNPDSTTTGSGQAMLVAPHGFDYGNIVNYGGLWLVNSRVNAPIENPSRDYIGFAFQTDNPHINYLSGGETLLFTFQKIGPCPDTLYLIENVVDPFDHLPNSAGTNPGNDLSVIDWGYSPYQFYYYSNNYAPAAWSCHDCDSDGILNAHEDTNGNGVWTSGVDATNICDPCSPVPFGAATLSLVDGGDHISLANPLDSAILKVEVEGRFSPFMVVISDGVANDTFYNFNSGETIIVRPSANATYSLVSVQDTFVCQMPVDSLSGEVFVEVEIAINCGTNSLTVTDQPDNITECSGGGVTFQTTISNTGTDAILYQWERSCDLGLTWEDVADGGPEGFSGATANLLAIGNVAGMGTCRFRVRYSTAVCPPAHSNHAVLAVEGPLSFLTQPQSATVCYGGPVLFEITTENAGSGDIIYRWQVSIDGGLNWSNLNTNSIYHGPNSPHLSVSNSAGLNGRCYRLSAKTADCPPIFSEPACLTVEGPISITGQPADVQVCNGETAIFTAAAQSGLAGTLEYQWQFSADDGTNWTAISDGTFDSGNASAAISGANTAMLVVGNAVGMGGWKFRMKAVTSSCQALSQAATLKSNQAHLLEQPQDYSTCEGTPANFWATVAQPTYGLLYQWQKSVDDGNTWTDLPNDFNYGGANTDTFLISDVTGMNGHRFRLLTWFSGCDTLISDEGVLIIAPSMSVVQAPTDAVVSCGDTEVSFSPILDGASANSTYKWEQSINGIWTDLTDGGPLGFSGSNSPELLVQNIDYQLNNRKFRLRFARGTCAAQWTPAATLTLENSLAIDLQPESIVTCADSGHVFSSQIVNLGPGSPNLQWQASTNGGLSWQNLEDGGPAGTTGLYQNTHSNALTISQVAGLDSALYRLHGELGYCETTTATALLLVDNDPNCSPVSVAEGCLKIKLQLLADSVTYGVFVKPTHGYSPTQNTEATFGKVALVVPADFGFNHITNHAGLWSLVPLAQFMPGDLSLKRLTFNLFGNMDQIHFKAGEETLLFTFRHHGACPDTMFVLGRGYPAISATQLLATDFGTTPPTQMSLCGEYDLDAWRCPDGFGNLEIEKLEIGATPNSTIPQFPNLTISPNPASEQLFVSFPNGVVEGAQLQVFDLQGRKVQETQAFSEGVMLSVGELRPGMYFLAWVQGGKVLERERFVKE